MTYTTGAHTVEVSKRREADVLTTTAECSCGRLKTVDGNDERGALAGLDEVHVSVVSPPVKVGTRVTRQSPRLGVSRFSSVVTKISGDGLKAWVYSGEFSDENDWYNISAMVTEADAKVQPLPEVWRWVVLP